jgi:hypothetical protein
VALAQIYGLRIPVGAPDNLQQEYIQLTKAGFNPDELRIPKGDPHGGEWTTGGASDDSNPSTSGQANDAPLGKDRNECIRYCYDRTEGMRRWGGDPFWACMSACLGRFPHPWFSEFNSHYPEN